MANEDKLSFLDQTPKPVQAPEHKNIYINGARMGVSPWDFRIIFSMANSNPEGEMINEDVVTVIMSPQHAKAMLRNWQNTIKAYEDMFGPIPDISPILEGRHTKPIQEKDTQKTVLSKKSGTKN